MRDRKPIPTDAELDILGVILRQGSASTEDVCTQLKPVRPLTTSSMNTLLMRMVHKGLVRRQKQGREYIYSVTAREELQESAARSLMERLFGGSLSLMVSSLLGRGTLSSAERDELRAMLDAPGGKGEAKP